MSDSAAFFLKLGDVLQWLGVGLSPLFLMPIALLVVPGLLKKPATMLISGIDWTTSKILTVGGSLMYFMAVVQLAAVIARYIYGLSFNWLSDLILYAFAATFMLAAAGAYANNAHVRVDILYSQMSAKRRALVEFIGIYFLLIPMMILILHVYAPSLAAAWRIFEGGNETDSLPIKYLFKTLIPTFAVLFLAQAFSQALKAALELRDVHIEHEDHHQEAAF